MKKKVVTLCLALVLVVAGVIGGTMAWLTAQADEVVNTFTASNIDITLEETTGESYKMVPGYTIDKNPTVTVKTGGEKCYLFVELTKSSNFDSFLTYEIADDWTELDIDNKVVYYRVVDTKEMGTEYPVLKDNKVIVLDSVTKANMNALKSGEEPLPTLTVTAYATQFNKNADENFSVNEAWTNIAGDNSNTEEPVV